MNPNRITQIRAYLTWCTRGVAALFLGFAGFGFGTRVFHGFSSLYYGGTFFDVAFGYAGPGGAGHSALGAIIVHLVMAFVLFLIAKRLSRWIITIPVDACPACGYPRPTSTPPNEDNHDQSPAPSTYCPECGLQGFTPNPPATDTVSRADASSP